MTLQQFIEYRNMIHMKAINRTKTFKDKEENYYWYRLKDIDNQFPAFKAIGNIKLKKDIK